MKFGKYSLDLSVPQVMGILNVTPDSFSDGGHFFSVNDAVQRARTMVAEGAAIVDVGGESTRPGAATVSVQEEIDRVVPVIERLAAEFSVPISIDTRKSEVMRAAVAAGAGMINDVGALRGAGALLAAAQLNVPVCLMHMQGEPQSMQRDPVYTDVVGEVKAFLAQRFAACVDAGIARSSILIDPGFGFGKTLQHNLILLRYLEAFTALGAPLLVGVSRKSMIGKLLGGAPPDERLFGGVALAMHALGKGARIIRTHDVRATADVVKMYNALTTD